MSDKKPQQFILQNINTILLMLQFLNMVEDCAPHAPIVFAPSRANEKRISKADSDRLQRQHPSMTDSIPVDSEDGTGVDESIVGGEGHVGSSSATHCL